MLEELGLDPADCKGTCDIISDAPRSWVVTVDKDSSEYIRNGFDNGDVGFAVWLAVKGSGFTKDRWTLEDTSDWNKSEACIEVISDENEPFPDDFGYYGYNEWEGTKYRLSRENIEYTPGQDAAMIIPGTWVTASMEYYATWNEEDFPKEYSGGASLSRSGSE